MRRICIERQERTFEIVVGFFSQDLGGHKSEFVLGEITNISPVLVVFLVGYQVDNFSFLHRKMIFVFGLEILQYHETFFSTLQIATVATLVTQYLWQSRGIRSNPTSSNTSNLVALLQQ